MQGEHWFLILHHHCQTKNERGGRRRERERDERWESMGRKSRASGTVGLAMRGTVACRCGFWPNTLAAHGTASIYVGTAVCVRETKFFKKVQLQRMIQQHWFVIKPAHTTKQMYLTSAWQTTYTYTQTYTLMNKTKQTSEWRTTDVPCSAPRQQNNNGTQKRHHANKCGSSDCAANYSASQVSIHIHRAGRTTSHTTYQTPCHSCQHRQ